MPGPRANISGGGAPITLRLIAGPIHYDFLLPADAETRARFAFAESAGVPLAHAELRWIVVGWGARDFYTTVGSYLDVTPRAVWRGLSGDTSVIHLDAAGPLSAGLDSREITMNRAQYSALLDAISEGFVRDETGRPVVLAGAAYGASDAFFEAHAPFNAVRTCNAWVGRMLRAAGLRFGLWTPLPYSVSLSHWVWQS